MKWAVVLALGAVIAGWAARPASAMSRAKANAIAMHALAPQKQRGRVVLFGLRKPLGARADVAQAGSTRVRKKKVVRRAVRPLGRKTWLFWEDLATGAKFEHPSVLLLVDDRTGKVRSKRRLLWYPMVNGKPAPFVGSSKQKYVVYTSLGKASDAAAARVPQATQKQPLQLPPNAFANDCLVMIGLFEDPQAKQDEAGMVAAARRYGMPTIGGVKSGEKRADPDGFNLIHAIDQVVKAPYNCKDVMIYVDGHGYRKGDPAVKVGERWYKTGKKDKKGRDVYKSYNADVDYHNLVAILKTHPSTTFKIVIDACFSGRFLKVVNPKKYPNLAIIATAANAKQYSYFFLKSAEVGKKTVVNKTDNPGVTSKTGYGRSEFTNGLLAGMEEFATSATAVADAKRSGGSLLAWMLEYGFEHEGTNDFAAQNGLTDPQEQDTLPPVQPDRAPDVSAISAVFVQADLATYYGVLASDPDGDPLTYTWSLSPPQNDPACKTFRPQNGSPSKAVWHHGDSDGCNHLAEGPDGHEGTVTVVVSDGYWNCTATYLGTNTGQGQTPTCVRK